MAEFDLIPKEYAQSQALRRRVKWFALALVAVVLVVASARLGLTFATRFENGEVARLRNASQVSAQARAAADAYRQQKLAAETQLSALDELRGHDRVRLFLGAMDAAYVNGVWFDDIRYYRGEPQASGSLSALAGGSHTGIIVVPKQNVAAAGSVAPAGAIEQRVELTGHALNHSLVADFMRALGGQPGIADVRLLDTGLRTYVNVSVIDFKLALLIDDRKGGRP